MACGVVVRFEVRRCPFRFLTDELIVCFLIYCCELLIVSPVVDCWLCLRPIQTLPCILLFVSFVNTNYFNLGLEVREVKKNRTEYIFDLQPMPQTNYDDESKGTAPAHTSSKVDDELRKKEQRYFIYKLNEIYIY